MNNNGFKLHRVYVGSQEDQVQMTHYATGCVFNETLRFNLDSGTFIDDYNQEWDQMAQEAMRKKQFRVDMLRSLHNHNVEDYQDCSYASPLMEAVIQHLILSDVDGDMILKSLKLHGFDIQGWKLIRVYIGGWKIYLEGIPSDVSSFLTWVSSNEPDSGRR